MKKIATTRGHHALVDDSDYETFGREHWQAIERNGRVNGVQRIKYLGGGKLNQRRKCLKLSREILGVTDPVQIVVFRDGDPLNNQRSNLAIVTRSTAGLIRPKKGDLALPLEVRFWKRVKVSASQECWTWTGTIHTGGYGRLSLPNKGGSEFAHRIAWTLKNGPIGQGLFVCHRCDNPPCCNPGHLFLGTLQDNVADMIAKGRNSLPPLRRGEESHNATLTNAQVVEVKLALRAGETGRAVARKFGVSVTVISMINTGRTWGHVDVASRSVNEVSV